MKIITLFTAMLSHVSSPSRLARCMHSSSIMSSTSNCKLAAPLATLHQTTQPHVVMVCRTVALVGCHVAEAAADLVARHTIAPTASNPAPTLALALSAKYASR
jgi:hypothetical protein